MSMETILEEVARDDHSGNSSDDLSTIITTEERGTILEQDARHEGGSEQESSAPMVLLKCDVEEAIKLEEDSEECAESLEIRAAVRVQVERETRDELSRLKNKLINEHLSQGPQVEKCDNNYNQEMKMENLSESGSHSKITPDYRSYLDTDSENED